jgi:hypothetical protein
MSRRLEPTQDDAAITARQVSRLIRWMHARGAAGNPVTIPDACGIAMRGIQDYIHFGTKSASSP